MKQRDGLNLEKANLDRFDGYPVRTVILSVYCTHYLHIALKLMSKYLIFQCKQGLKHLDLILDRKKLAETNQPRNISKNTHFLQLGISHHQIY